MKSESVMWNVSRTCELEVYSVTPKVCAELASKTRVKSRGILSLLKKFQTLENPFWETDLMRLWPDCDGGGADLGRTCLKPSSSRDEGETVNMKWWRKVKTVESHSYSTCICELWICGVWYEDQHPLYIPLLSLLCEISAVCLKENVKEQIKTG